MCCEPREVKGDHWAEFTVPEAITAIAGYAASFSPSLLPRPWYFQGLVAGMSAMFGHQAGLVAGWTIALVAKRLGRPIRLRPGVRTGGRVAGAAIWTIGSVVIPLASIRQHRRTADYVKRSGPDAFWAVAATGVAASMFALLTAQWRTTRWSINFVARHLHQRGFTVGLLSRLIATFTVLTTIIIIFDQVIMRGVVGVAATASAQVDRRIPPNVVQPTNLLHSGSAASLESWDSLGLQGKRFSCAGPSRERILEVLGEHPDQPTKDPVRAYASMNGRSLAEVVAAVIAEFDRTDAWARRAILVVTTTGRGNVKEWSASAFEFLMRGDCAIAAMQYSGLPSAVTMLSSKQQPVEASRLLFETIERRLAEIPAARRPKLYVAGESLGAFGSNGIFNSADDLQARAAGGVWTGCPTFTPLHREFTAARDLESTAVLPVVDGGRHVRFAMSPDQLTTTPTGVRLTEWQEPRFAYLQNDTDPVVWWGTDLGWRRPAWLTETSGSQTPMGQMTWWPFITFWQIAADMPVSRSVGPARGHKYHAEQCVPAWAGVLGHDPTADWSAIIDALNADVPPVAP